VSLQSFFVKIGLLVGANGSNAQIGVNTTTPVVTLDIQANDAIRLPYGNTGQQPATSNGLIRFNSDIQHPEYVVLGANYLPITFDGEIGAL
jgi:hypothetical protein